MGQVDVHVRKLGGFYRVVTESFYLGLDEEGPVDGDGEFAAAVAAAAAAAAVFGAGGVGRRRHRRRHRLAREKKKRHQNVEKMVPRANFKSILPAAATPPSASWATSAGSARSG